MRCSNLPALAFLPNILMGCRRHARQCFLRSTRLRSAMRLTGMLDRDALEAALGDLVERHESLRTIYPDTVGIPRQVILAASSTRPQLAVVTGMSEDALPEALASMTRRGFDLSRELPLHAHLFVLSESEHVLLLVLHHIACDGWSMAVLRRILHVPIQLAAGAACLICLHCRCNMPTTRFGSRKCSGKRAIRIALWHANLLFGPQR